MVAYQNVFAEMTEPVKVVEPACAGPTTTTLEGEGGRREFQSANAL
jgi:hypothetical protein